MQVTREARIAAGRIPRWALWVIWLVVPVALGLLSVKLGATFSWDARMYHYYNGFAFLEDRLGHDVAPAARQSFHNPLPDVPFYLAYRYLFGPPAGLLLGVLHGLNFPLLVWLVWVILPPATGDRSRILLALGLGVLGTLHESFLVQLGGAGVDNIVSLFVLGALIILLGGRGSDRAGAPATLRVGLAGLCLGAACGLKLTAAVFCVGAGVAILVLPAPRLTGRLHRVAVLAAGGVAGFAATGGSWAFKLWTLTGNPFFPYLNQIFRSPLVAGRPYEYRNFLSTDTLLWRDPDVINEELWALRTLATDDVRYPIVGVLLCLVLVVRFFDRSRRTDTVVDQASGVFVVVFACTTFVVWLKVFAVARYLLPISLVTPIVVVALLDQFTANRRVRLGGLSLLAIIVLATVGLASAERVPWEPNPYRIDLDAVELANHSTVVIIDLEPVAYMIPSFPDGVRFVRPGGNLFLKPWNPLHNYMTDVIAAGRGSVFTLQSDREYPRFSREEILKSVRVRRNDRACVSLRAAGDLPGVHLCPARVSRRPAQDGRAGPGPDRAPRTAPRSPAE